jgi:hypothetical protein
MVQVVEEQIRTSPFSSSSSAAMGDTYITLDFTTVGKLSPQEDLIWAARLRSLWTKAWVVSGDAWMTKGT